jgi:hypothetical protein
MRRVVVILGAVLALASGGGCVTSHAVHLEPIHVEPIHVRMDVNVRMENVESSGDEADEGEDTERADEPSSGDE